MIYLLLFMVTAFILTVYVYNINSKVTMPSAVNYLYLVKSLHAANNQTQAALVKNQFMQFVVDLGICSLEKQTGVGYFRLPQLGQVFVLSDPSAIKQFYERKNDARFSQLRFFNGLSIILGPNNLMSSALHSSIHTKVRKSIFNRNEKMIPNLADLVCDFLSEYAKQEKILPLGEVMNALSRRVLLSTYFDASFVATFEKKYDAKLTEALLSSIFELDVISEDKRFALEVLRNRLFLFGRDLLQAKEASNVFGENSWINYLLSVHLNDDSFLPEMGIHCSPLELNISDWTILLDFATHDSEHPFAPIIRDVVNESLFIPLLGFDATATMLITALRIAIQDPRINKIVDEEVWQLTDKNHSLELHGVGSARLSYIEAVILESLRLSPPAPVIPEIVTETFSLNVKGKTLELPAGALVFMPMEGLHTHRANYPDIPLSKKGQKIFKKECIDSKTIFPERWKPMTPKGKPYNADFFENTWSSPDAFFTFKKGARQCPGQRLALSEAIGIFQFFKTHQFSLDNEESLNFPFHYDCVFQRHGGQGKLLITPKKEQNKTKRFINYPSQEAPCISSVSKGFLLTHKRF